MRHSKIRSESGIITLIALIMVGMLTMIGIAVMSTSDDEVNIAGNEMHDVRAFYAAEAGLERASVAIETAYEVTGVSPHDLPAGKTEANDCVIVYGSADDGPEAAKVLSGNTLAGLDAMVKSFSVVSTASDPGSHTAVQMSQSFEIATVPIFQYNVFYNGDLEMSPGPGMSSVGRVHANGDLYVQSNSNFNMDDYVTASGKILHDVKGPGAVGGGDIKIKDGAGSYIGMKKGADFLDHTSPNWFDSSLSRWQGQVEDSAHGQQDLNIPVGGDGDPHNIIEPAAGNPDSYETKASLKYIEGSWYQQIGAVWQDVTAGMAAAGIFSQSANQFHDARENVGVDVVDMDVDALMSSGFAPSNGIIYFSDVPGHGGPSDFPALRLYNGAELGGPLTVASNNPVYTLGDFNKTNKQPAAILADAYTVLSSAWNDALGENVYTDRVANNTSVNVSFITGNQETTAGNYNGGFENLIRLLEDWDHKDFNWTGSAVRLWESAQAAGLWNTSYFGAPTRNWSYDTDLDDPALMPPGTPAARVFQRTGWKQEDVGFSQVFEVAKGSGTAK